MNLLIEFVNNFIALQEDEKILLTNSLDTRKYKPAEIILGHNKICKELIFVVSGTAKSTFINENGQEFTWSFYFNDKYSNFENLFALDYNSFLRQTPTSLTLQAIDEVNAITLRYDKWQKLLAQSHEMQSLGRIMNEQAFNAMHKRAFSLLTQSAKERYLKLLDEEPYLLNKFPHYLVASYLGIAPQSLSRLRKEILRPK